GAADLAAPLVVELLADVDELVPHDLPPPGLALQDPLDAPRLLLLGEELLADGVDLQARQLVELHLEDRVDLHVVEIAALGQLGGGVLLALRAADELDGLIEPVEDLDESLEDMDSPQELGEVEAEAPGDDVEPEIEEVPERSLEIEPRRRADLDVLGGY